MGPEPGGGRFHERRGSTAAARRERRPLLTRRSRTERHAAPGDLPGAVRAIWLALLAALVPLGLLTKRYHGAGAAWVHANAGDGVYAAFWFFLLRFVRPRLGLGKSAAAVFLFCCVIEFSQRLHAPWLAALRQTLPGRLVLGNDFDPVDIADYAAGIALAAGLSLAVETAARRATGGSEK